MNVLTNKQVLEHLSKIMTIPAGVYKLSLQINIDEVLPQISMETYAVKGIIDEHSN